MVRSCIVLLALLLAPAQSWGWGATGHRLIGQVAAAALPDEIPAFLRSADAVWQLGELAREPDRSKGSGVPHDADLDPGHSIRLDDDGSAAGVALAALPRSREAFDAALRAKGTDEYRMGYLPYSIVDGWQQVVKDFAYWRVDAAGERGAASAEDRAWFAKDRALREAILIRDIGYWSHFVGDATQPMHVSVHVSGWGNFPNPEGYTNANGLHAWVEGAFVRASVAKDAVAARLAPYRDCGCAIAERVASYLLASHAQVIPLYALEKAGGFTPGDARGAAFVTERLAAAASELRDMILDAWRRSADAKVGYPEVSARDVEAGKAMPLKELQGLD